MGGGTIRASISAAGRNGQADAGRSRRVDWLMTVRVVVVVKIPSGQEADFEAAFEEVSRQVRGTPGHVRDELLREQGTQGAYVLLGEWESAGAFHAWHDNPAHSAITAPMHPFWLGRTERRMYDIAVRLDT